MSIFSEIFNWFKHMFGAHGAVLQTVIQDSSDLINKALPIVEDLRSLVPDTSVAPTAALSKIEGFIQKFEPDATKAQTVLAGLTGKSTADILLNAAQWALSLAFPGAAASALRFAIETALQMVLKAFEKSPAPSTPVPEPTPTA